VNEVAGQVRRVSAWRLGLLTGVLLILAGCGPSRVSVPEQFPVPLVQKLPLAVAARLDDVLLNYAHTEELETGREWHIELGTAQTTLFRNLLAGMFARSDVLQGEGSGSFDAVLVPSIEELQFTTPDQTKTDYFEVWIRYQMKLYDADGALVAEWPLTAYGQANARNFGMQGQEPALQAAALAACRDAMAFFVVQFRTIPAVEAWLAAKTGAAPT